MGWIRRTLPTPCAARPLQPAYACARLRKRGIRSSGIIWCDRNGPRASIEMAVLRWCVGGRWMASMAWTDAASLRRPATARGDRFIEGTMHRRTHTFLAALERESIDRPTDATNPYTHQLTPQRAGRPQAAAFASFHLYIRSRRPPQAAAAAASEQMAAAAPSGSGSEGGSNGSGGSGYSWQARCQMGKVQGEMAVGADGLYWRQDGWVWVCFVCVE